LLQHVALELHPADRRAAERFFELLGLEPVEPPERLRERSSWLQRGGTQIHLLFSDEPVAPPQGHCALVVDDYDAVLHALRAAGHDVEERPQHWGAARAFAAAPGGHRIELMAAPPA
jgi:catechol 2,3-dioxygenase-like lactoylglutathione lyase family enzyme